MENPINEIKENVNDIRHSIDGMKADMQGALNEEKDATSVTRESMARWKDGDSDEEDEVLLKDGNAYVIRTQAGQVGEITYAPDDDHTWVINHTYVSPSHRGRDLAQRLLQAVVEEARAENKKIIPACSYVLVQFKRNKEYADVWKR